jgi:hypothetical protein
MPISYGLQSENIGGLQRRVALSGPLPTLMCCLSKHSGNCIDGKRVQKLTNIRKRNLKSA